jgi:hypothetical protein
MESGNEVNVVFSINPSMIACILTYTFTATFFFAESKKGEMKSRLSAGYWMREDKGTLMHFKIQPNPMSIYSLNASLMSSI